MLAYLRRFDWFLLGAAALLNAVGLAVLYSTSLATSAVSSVDFGNFWKQFAFAGLGLFAAAVVASFDYRALSALARPLYLLAVGLLLGVLFFGSTVRGATGWFRLGPFSLQPVEIVKLLLVVFLAKFFSDFSRDPGGLRRILGSSLAFGLIFGLVLLQPDLGSGLLLLVTWGVMLLMSGVRRNHLIVMASLCVLGAVFAWMFVLQPYQKQRLTVFLDPGSDPRGSGYNVTQSIIAVGSGGFFGKGLGFGSQSQLRYLPERQTDFIFSVVAEELGLAWVIVVCSLFGILFWRAWLRARRAKDDFTLFLAIGITVSLAIEMTVNIGGALGLLPVTGVTLPFVSYGGSSLLMKYVMIGTLEAVAVRE